MMKLYTLNNNAHVVIGNTNLFHLFSYDSEVLVYNPRDNGITVYTNIANYSQTTKKHIRMFCDKFLDDLEVVPAILDPKKNCKDYKILHIINEQFRQLNQVKQDTKVSKGVQLSHHLSLNSEQGNSAK